jgi:hypothetical protein
MRRSHLAPHRTLTSVSYPTVPRLCASSANPTWTATSVVRINLSPLALGLQPREPTTRPMRGVFSWTSARDPAAFATVAIQVIIAAALANEILQLGHAAHCGVYDRPLACQLFHHCSFIA